MPTCKYCGESFSNGEGEIKHAGECAVMIGDSAFNTQELCKQAHNKDDHMVIPAGWFVYTVCLDAEVPYCTICNSEDVNEERKVKIPESLAYYLSTHFCGSQKMHDKLIEDGKRQLRNQIKNILGI